MQTKIEKIDSSSALAVKIIEGQTSQTLDFLSFREKLSYANISHPEKKKEWATARFAIYDALKALKVPYPGFFKDEHGKSQSMNSQGYVSLTHTPGYAAAIFHREQPVGIDMDLIREKILKIGFRFLDTSEVDFLEKDPTHYTMAWSAKESIFKCQGKRGVSFRENILLEPFEIDALKIKGKIRGTDFADHHYTVEVRRLENVILTYTIW
ncbi:4'-phosphopantetheinyl transferase superfamily protein [Algoriphagus alkaliphilus]|uniref:4'-phosphopantetheinyl transferase superfamily protein n=1 Tax=Algoriphagus alkaliphilus TaxID=279824 RepID=A0A1G5ZI18_9BACT|nr:4'-phosphopantetheinyl transferase superfamily protein [Algoriphagus alkaliphilus]MBA4300231.1 4-phosphopantetheinyl transferase [Cyclobacterium sp.]SDA94519.1 4'-phosphopantetheinyl transferase superfamily protein [Algoriphagus alkaliphilus]